MKEKNDKATAKAAETNDDQVEIVDNVEVVADEDSDKDAVKEAAAEELTEIESLNKQLLETQEQLAKEKKEYLFLMAEFDNFRKRTMREKAEIIKNANEKAMKALLPVVDDFERGLEANSKSDDAEAIKQGMELIYNKLVRYLKDNGVTPIESNGTAFDPDLHEGIAMVPTEDESMKGKVIDTPAKGYMINDKVLRHAKVAVGQ